MTTEFTDRFDCEQLLALDSNLQVDQAESSSLTEDGAIVLKWAVPYGSAEECKKWLYSNRRVMSDFDTPFRHFEGTYRATKIDFVVNRERDGTIIGATVMLYLALGLFTTIDWSMASVLAGEEVAPGNDSEVEGVDDTSSDDPENVVRVEFRYCDPKSVSSMINSISDSEFTNPVVFGETITGTFHRIFASSRKEQDGTATITLTLANPQYTIKSYSDFGGFRQSDNWYLWRVPKTLAQGIIDDFKDTYPVGASATANYDNADHLVNITLTSDTNVNLSLNSGWIDTACDTKIRYIYGWGMTEAQVGAFLALHDTIPFEGTEGGTSPSGMSRSVETNPRGNGLHDVVIKEQWVQYNINKHQFAFHEYSGSNIDNYHIWGFGVPLSEFTAIRTDYEKPEANKKKVFKVTYKGECSYDFELICTTITSATLTTTEAGTGIKVSVDIKKNQTDVPTITANKRERVSLDADINDVGSYDIKASKQTVVESTDAASKTGDGSTITVMAGKNVDSGDLATAMQSQTIIPGKRNRVQVELSANDDNTFDYRATKSSVPKTTDSASTSATNGCSTSVWTAKNVDPGDLDTLLAAGSGIKPSENTKVSININANDDGTIDYSVIKLVVASASGSASSLNTKQYYGKGMTALPSVTGERLVAIDVKPNEDGTVDYSIRTEAIVAKAALLSDGRNKFRTIDDASDTTGLLGSGEILDSASIKVGVDGTISGSSNTIDPSGATEITGAVSGKLLSKVTEELHELDDSVDAAVDPIAGQDISLEMQIDDKTGLIKWHKKITVESPKELPALVVGTSLDADTIIHGEDATALPTITVDQGITADVKAVLKANGLYDYSGVIRDASEKSATATSFSSIGPVDIRVDVTVVENATDEPAASTGFTNGIREEYSNVKQNSDATYNYTKTVTALSINSAAADGLVIKSADMTEHYRDVVWKHYWTEFNIFGCVIRKYSRNVVSTTTREYSLAPIAASGAGSDEQKTSEYADGVWIRDTLAITYGPWTEDGLIWKSSNFDPADPPAEDA